jgi:hypothetical protein
MWGYWLDRPALDPRFVNAKRFLAVARVWGKHRDSPVDALSSLQEQARASPAELEDGPCDRVLPLIERLQPVESIASHQALELSEILPLPGIDDWAPQQTYPELNNGVVVDAIGTHDERLRLVSICEYIGGDSHMNHDFLFELSDQQPRLLSRRSWNYDVAGAEDATWPVLTFMWAMPLGALYLAATLVNLWAWWRRGRRTT